MKIVNFDFTLDRTLYFFIFWNGDIQIKKIMYWVLLKKWLRKKIKIQYKSALQILIDEIIVGLIT